MSQGRSSQETPRTAPSSISISSQTSYDWSEELRIAGPNNGHRAGELGWVAGTYFSNGNGTNFFTGLGAPNQPAEAAGKCRGRFRPGQPTASPTRCAPPRGLRYTHDEKGVEDVYGSNVTAPYDHINYRFGLEANPAPNSLLYASVSTGYVAGGADGGSVDADPRSDRAGTAYLQAGKHPRLRNRVEEHVPRRTACCWTARFFYYIIKNFQSYNPGYPEYRHLRAAKSRTSPTRPPMVVN